MSNTEKFEGFKKKMIDENKEKYTEMQQLSLMINQTLKQALEEVDQDGNQTCDPAGDLARKVCEMHQKWLCFY